MPFETGAGAPKRVAVIGAGISGMGAAYELANSHAVTLFEAEPRLGGHARTVMAGRNGDQPVDTGFIVFNKVNYPRLVSLFEELDVPITESNMSFGVSINDGALEYALTTLDTLYAQRRNFLKPAFQRMVRDIVRFNSVALEVSEDRSLSAGDLLDVLKMGPWFRSYYLEPFSGAIWSTPKDKILDFPAWAMMRFFDNHNLLSASGQHQWYTVRGGSVAYVSRLEEGMRRRGVDLRPGTPVQSVRRHPTGVEIKAWGGEWEAFDEVIFATHSDDSLRLLSDPTQQEAAILGAVAYQPNEITLHADESVMPKRRKVWSSWNYSESARCPSDNIDLTYWMNSLQPIPKDDPHFVTLNTRRPIREDLIYDSVTLRHPVYDAAALEAQAALKTVNGTNNTWFCGAWVKNGFHEDGLSSAIDVVAGMTRINAMRIAAE